MCNKISLQRTYLQKFDFTLGENCYTFFVDLIVGKKNWIKKFLVCLLWCCFRTIEHTCLSLSFVCFSFNIYTVIAISKAKFLLIISNVAAGQMAFQEFLKSEYSEENILFWLACEEYKKITSVPEMISMANQIYTEFVQTESPRQVTQLKVCIWDKTLLILYWGHMFIIPAAV